MKLRTQKLTWINREGQQRELIGNEDQVDCWLGELMNSYWDSENGWTTEWKIIDLETSNA